MRHALRHVLTAATLAAALAISISTSRAADSPPRPGYSARELNGASQPELTSETRTQLAAASQDQALAPWQREFMNALAASGASPVPGGAAPSRRLAPEMSGQLVRASHVALPATATALDGTWSQVPPPTRRYLHSAIYDPVRNRMVIFGGSAGGNLNDVWALSLNGAPTWIRLATANTPPSGRFVHTAIYDTPQDRMIVFAGIGASGAFNEVWSLSMVPTSAWTQLSPSGTPPSARYAHAAIFDPVRDRMVVFGGFDGANPLNDVWTLSLSGSPIWNPITPSGTPPSARYRMSSIYDSVNDRMLIFGGSTSTTLMNDVWALSLAGTPAWTKLTPTGTPPSARVSHTAILDPLRSRMLIFGGSDAAGYRNDVWSMTLSGTPNWAQLTVTGTPPSARDEGTAIYDSFNDRMVVFAGNSTAGLLNDVWALTLAGTPAWSQLSTGGTGPASRGQQTSIYDPVRNRMVVFGGAISGGSLNDVWTLSLASTLSWTKLTPSGTAPVARHSHAAIYDPGNDRMVVYGGTDGENELGDVWAMSLGASPAWTKLAPTGTPPSLRDSHSAIYDPVRARMVVFGGFNGTIALSDVWALSLTGAPAWTQLAPAGTTPDPRQRHTAIYDPVRDQMVVFGGLTAAGDVSDLWSLSFAGAPLWEQITPSSSAPLARESHTAIYDSGRGRMIIFGGIAGGLYAQDVWALPLSSSPQWVQLAPDGPTPNASVYSSAIFDPSAGRMLVFGGSSGSLVNDLNVLTWGVVPLAVSPGASGDRVSLAAVFPNPSRSDISISFTTPRGGDAELRVFDVTGRAVRTLLDGPISAGSHAIRWDRRTSSGALAGPGLYFYELLTDGQKLSRRVVLIE